MKIKTLLLNFLLFLALAAPAFAESKSHTVQVSCVVPEMLEMRAPLARSIQARTSLEKRYQMTDQMCLRGNERIKLYSLTAL
jgi:hypothetical protein